MTNAPRSTLDAIDSFFAVEQDERAAIQTEASGLLELDEKGNITEKPLDLSIHVDTFPVEHVPRIVGDYIAEVSRALEIPADVPALMMLAALAVPMAGRYSIEAWPGWTEPLNLYVCAASDPGTLKTPALRAAMAPLWEFESAMRDDWSRERDRIESDNAAQPKGAPKKAIPPIPTWFVDDITPETLASKMGQHGERMTIATDEGTAFKHMTGAYSANPNNTIWLKAHDGSRVSIDRRDDSKHVTLKRPLLTLALAIQPEILRSAAAKPELRGVGMLARFLFAVPESTVDQMTFRAAPVAHDSRARYRQLILALCKVGADLNPNGEPSKIECSPEASEILRQVSCAIAARCAIGEDLHCIADWASKLRGKIARLAGLFHCAEQVAIGVDPMRIPVAAETMYNAASLAPYFISHAKKAFFVMRADLTNKLSQDLLRFMGKNGLNQCTARITCRKLGVNSSDAKKALSELVSQGIMKLVNLSGGSRGPKVQGYELTAAGQKIVRQVDEFQKQASRG